MLQKNTVILPEDVKYGVKGPCQHVQTSSFCRQLFLITKVFSKPNSFALHAIAKYHEGRPESSLQKYHISYIIRINDL